MSVPFSYVGLWLGNSIRGQLHRRVGAVRRHRMVDPSLRIPCIGSVGGHPTVMVDGLSVPRHRQ